MTLRTHSYTQSAFSSLLLTCGLWVLVSYCCTTELLAQDSTWQVHAKIEVTASQYYSDQLENIYVIQQNLLTKYDRDGRRVASYSNPQYGVITSVDVTNPLRILVFYRQHARLVQLDKFLTALDAPILLTNLTPLEPEAVCSSTVGSFWMFNPDENRLLCYDKFLDEVRRSVNLATLIDFPAACCGITEQSNRLFACFSGYGLLVFDRYGTFYKVLPDIRTAQIQVKNELIYYFQDRTLSEFNLQTGRSRTLQLPGPLPMNVLVEQSRLFMIYPSHITIYRNK